MTRTRSSKPASAKASSTSEPTPTTSKYTLASNDNGSQLMFILPSKASKEARIANLPHPKSGSPTKYLICPDTGLYEFTRIAAPKTMPRSWLIEAMPVTVETVPRPESNISESHIMRNQDLFVATAFDPLFIILPALVNSKASREGEEKRRLFLSSEDYFDKLPTESSHLVELLRCEKTRKRLETRMSSICDSVEAGDESMFHINEKKLAAIIWGKAKQLGQAGNLAASIEEKFVKKALEAPLLFQRRDMKADGTTNTNVATADSCVSTPKTEATDSQLSINTEDGAVSMASQVSTAATSVVEEVDSPNLVATGLQASEEILRLQRIRVAFEFICARYLPDAISQQLKESAVAKDAASVDFTVLDQYIQKLDQLRSEALTVRSASDQSRKRGYDDEEEEIRAEKRRKLEEEKKRKATQSRAVKELKKVNITGMKKLSDFFIKK